MPYAMRFLFPFLLFFIVGDNFGGAVPRFMPDNDVDTQPAKMPMPGPHEQYSHGESMRADAVDEVWSDLNINTTCARLLRQFAKPSPFSLVGHFTHSLTLRDLRRYFDRTASAINHVPTINMDTSSDDPLLPHAVDIPAPEGSHHFETEAMKTVDLVLSHMDDKNWDIKYFTTLEKMVHAFHMEEVWTKAQKQFELMQKSPPSSQLCECVMDIESNGILKFLRFSALAIREPSLIYNTALKEHKGDNAKRYGFTYPVYTYHFKLNTANSFENVLMRDEKQSMQRLTSADAWRTWKRIGCTSPEEDYNNALFMHCAIQKAHAK